MGRVFIDESTLTAIGDAIRNKTGGEDLISPGNFANEITNLPSGGIEPEPLVLTGNCNNYCAGKVSGKYIEMYGDTITTENINSATYMFSESPLTRIPFEINFNSNYSLGNSMTYMFNDAQYLTEVPKINNAKPSEMRSLFHKCFRLRNIPENYGEDWDWSKITGQTSSYSGDTAAIFMNCYSLRNAPMSLLKNYNPNTSYSNTIYNNAFYNCYVLDEVVDLPVVTNTLTSNALGGIIQNCYRLKRFTFATDNGKPYTANWKNQLLRMDLSVGWHDNHFNKRDNIIGYNSGITADKEVKYPEHYEKLKNDNDWFTLDATYCRYNHDSAVETLRSLPDTTAYGTNGIQFATYTASGTDGGSVSTLTEEEIAIAAVKGWTITFA